MGQVSLRFYQELNDFLPGERRQRPFDYPLQPTQSVKHLIENLGVPHTEVEIILVNGRSVDFTYQPADGDRISVYPMFERLDVTPLLRLRPQPLREPRFIADAHLGKLARHLRLVGFDTLFFNDAGDDRLARISIDQGRILLTRDRALLMRRELTHGCFIHAIEPEQQLAELFRRLDLFRGMAPFTRCMECNGSLRAVAREQVVPLVPKRVAELYTEFWRCGDCARIYWKGSHYRELSALIERTAVALSKQH
jgi:uncharacterized protein with PIN domain